MKTKNIYGQDGFAALISAILVSSVLLVMAVPLARAAFWARFDLLARENKKISLNLARSCADLALLKIARGENIVWEKCEIGQIVDQGGGVWEITAGANWKGSFVNLKVIAELENNRIEIIGWEEF